MSSIAPRTLVRPLRGKKREREGGGEKRKEGGRERERDGKGGENTQEQSGC